MKLQPCIFSFFYCIFSNISSADTELKKPLDLGELQECGSDY